MAVFKLWALLALAALASPATASAARCAAQPSSFPPADTATVPIAHALGPCSPLRPPSAPWPDLLQHLASLDLSRHLYLSSLAAVAAPVASGRQLVMAPIYVARATFGRPPQPLLVAVDNSNDVAWVPCAGCSGCTTTATFNPSASSSYSSVPCAAPQCALLQGSCSKSCTFGFGYAGSTATAALSRDSVAVAGDPAVKQFFFGCLQRVSGTPPSLPAQGLLGLGRGPLSFVSQTAGLYASTFSYCLPSYKSVNFSGSLRLGPAGQPKRIKTTPLLSNPRRPSLYYVNMTGVKIGNRLAQIPPSALAFDPNTGAGTVVDVGTMFTLLAAPAYAAVRDAFRARLGGAPVASLGGFDTCYNVTAAVPPPSVTLVFDGMQVTLPEENVMIHSSSGTLACLAMAAAPSDGVNAALNVVASMQQQNHRVLFDVPGRRVGFAREPCTAA